MSVKKSSGQRERPTSPPTHFQGLVALSFNKGSIFELLGTGSSATCCMRIQTPIEVRCTIDL
ncbi:MAG: hypothetical protein EP343_05950 [Deltaproteobacteria bacterium]|nr:MAG: hypothetical protein EP343_05950 [Deltaproteobacteria bacterium]